MALRPKTTRRATIPCSYDPIFRALRAYREAQKRSVAAAKAAAEFVLTDHSDDAKAAREFEAAAIRRELRLAYAACNIVPVSLAGMRAFTRFVKYSFPSRVALHKRRDSDPEAFRDDRSNTLPPSARPGDRER